MDLSEKRIVKEEPSRGKETAVSSNPRKGSKGTARKVTVPENRRRPMSTTYSKDHDDEQTRLGR